MGADYDEQVEEEIPGTVYVFALTDDEDSDINTGYVSNLSEYDLPVHFVHEQKSSGGVCTIALLTALASAKNAGAGGGKKKKKKPPAMSWADALDTMRAEITDGQGLPSQVPTLSTSRPIEVAKEPFRIASASKKGVKRALLIGIHYEDDKDEDVQLSICHDDVRQIRKHLIHEEGFEPANILALMDDGGRHHAPTKGLILDSLERLCQISKPGDSIFVLFSGHGGRYRPEEDEDDEDAIVHELLAPSDYRQKSGVLVDDELYSSFITQIPDGVHAVAVIDTCHPPASGTGKPCAFDLPYMCDAGDDELRHSKGFTPGRAMIASVAGGAAAAAAVSAGKKKKKGKAVEEKKGKKGKPTKKKKQAEEGDEEEEANDGEKEIDLDSKKKGKPKKKKKGEKEAAAPEGKEEEEKPKKKKKKGAKAEAASEEEPEDEKPTKKKKKKAAAPKKEEAAPDDAKKKKKKPKKK